jgi:indole-3-glycerol phosphate synthase
MILDSIFANRKNQIAALKEKTSTSALEKQAFDYAKSNNTKDFAGALKGSHLNVIAEVKKASPSKGLICENFEPVSIARQYEDEGASAVSVLTEESYFMGSAEYLKAIRKEIALPILRKDFIFDEYQICEARLIGADAILLIAAMLDTPMLTRLLNYAESLDLQALVETHSEEEVENAVKAGASVFGVNNRNLYDFSVDLGCALRLGALLPKGSVFVAESGVHNAEDARRMREAGADAVLVGEALMRAPSISEKLAELKVD